MEDFMRKEIKQLWFLIKALIWIEILVKNGEKRTRKTFWLAPLLSHQILPKMVEIWWQKGSLFLSYPFSNSLANDLLQWLQKDVKKREIYNENNEVQRCWIITMKEHGSTNALKGGKNRKKNTSLFWAAAFFRFSVHFVLISIHLSKCITSHLSSTCAGWAMPWGDVYFCWGIVRSLWSFLFPFPVGYALKRIFEALKETDTRNQYPKLPKNHFANLRRTNFGKFNIQFIEESE